MDVFGPMVGHRSGAARGVARGAVVAFATAAILTGSFAQAEARRGSRVLQGIGIGVGTAIILNEVLKAGEEKERRGGARAAPAAPRVSLDGERVRALQTALVAHGYDAGSPDGVWGNKARTATIQFQHDLGKPQTGTLSGEQIVLLRDATAGRIPQRVTARLDQAATIADEGGLRSDSSQDDIRDLQSVLTQMGFYNGAIDGSWGRGVEAAVTRFQQHEGAPPLGRLTLDQSERVLGRTLAHAEAPTVPSNAGSYQGRASEPQKPVRVMSVQPAARDGGAGLRFQDLPRAIQTHVKEVRQTCSELSRDTIPTDEMQGIQQITLESSQAILVDNLQLCTDHLPGANCSNRGCDLVIWQFENTGSWTQTFSEHLHGRELDIDPQTRQLHSMSVGLYAGDTRCAPTPGRDYTSGQSCRLNVTYTNGRWNYAIERRSE